MPVVRGDRIGESMRLNLRSVEAQDFYAHLVSAIPDDFRRFRLVPSIIAGDLYPRREITTKARKRISRLLHELGTGDLPLWKTWVVDGVTFAELTTGKDRGNKYHRTPEPPWSEHVHQGICIHTAIARARDWGTGAEVSALSLLKKELQERKRTGETLGHGVERPSPSSPSSPGPRSTDIPPLPPADAGGDFVLAPGLEHPAGNNGQGDRISRRAVEGILEQACLHAIALGYHPNRDDRRHLREEVKAGFTLGQITAWIDEAKARGQPVLYPSPKRVGRGG